MENLPKQDRRLTKDRDEKKNGENDGQKMRHPFVVVAGFDEFYVVSNETGNKSRREGALPSLVSVRG